MLDTASIAPSLQLCTSCGKGDHKLIACTLCLLGSCSVSCEQHHWDTHKKTYVIRDLPQLGKEIKTGSGEGTIHIASWRGQKIIVKALKADINPLSFEKELLVL